LHFITKHYIPVLQVLEKEFGIPNASFNVFGLDPWSCYYSFTASATRTYALIGAAAMLSAAHSIIVESPGGGGGGGGVSALTSALGSAPSIPNPIPISIPIHPIQPPAAAFGAPPNSSLTFMGGGFAPAQVTSVGVGIGVGGLASSSGLGSASGSGVGGIIKVIVLVQSLAISRAYRGRRCTIEFLQYIVSDAISQFPETTNIFLCTYCNKHSPAYASLLAKSFVEDSNSRSYPPSITAAGGEQYVAMIASVGNLLQWLSL
jgi:hypothetical protein